MLKLATLLLLMLVSFIDAFAQPHQISGYLNRDPSRKEVIVFVHGVIGDAKDTWTNEQTKAYWPSLIRSDETFSAANVWVFSFFSPKLQNAQNVEELARKLGDELRAQDVMKSHDQVFFLAHSMGGLITREMLTQQLPAPNKVPMIYFFGTPSAGADLAGVAAAISSNPQFVNMRPFTRESDVASFSRRWLSTAENPNARYPQKIWSFCAYEIQPVAADKLVVNEGSATFLCSTSPRASLATHITMVKPADRTAEPYGYFVSAYKFSKSSEAKFLASAEALTLHSTSSPGFNTGSLELRVASAGSQPIFVDCNQVETGERRLSIPLKSTERLVAVKPNFEFLSEVQTTALSYTFDPAGSVTVGYRVQGRPASPVSGCSATGRAQVGVQYLIEQR